ncbi:KpsF/GutQ family sugar-phosphate isomerase [Photobacterium indicum]|uniref:KpsF/GutQ family sugar-phosphate isomerase n=1 Tax=Photobacterium indicum TaxID=81447 RepID=UPI003D11995F
MRKEMGTAYNNEAVYSTAVRIIEKELEQAGKLINFIDENFANACNSIVNCNGKVIVSGIGKSGHIGKKIAATFASTGTPSFFIHLAEALHGDLGMIEDHDFVIFISNSGEANEFKTILPLLINKNVETIAMTRNIDSFLANNTTYTLPLAIDEEACPLGLAPSSSAVNTLILGDALALTAMTIKGFSKHDFAMSHPAGALGHHLLTEVKQIIKEPHQLAFCDKNTTLVNAISIMCKTGLGLISVLENQHVIGVLTDGDLRRSLHNKISLNEPIYNVMTQKFKTINQHELCSYAINVMTDYSITALPVIDEQENFIGVINLNSIHEVGIY